METDQNAVILEMNSGGTVYVQVPLRPKLEDTVSMLIETELPEVVKDFWLF